MPEPTYLGDSVYAEVREHTLYIYTNNGSGPQHLICIECEVYSALVEYVERCVEKGEL